MGNYLRKAFGARRADLKYSTLEIENWVLPAWFKKQSEPLNPGYAFGSTDFVNSSFRNWIELHNEKGGQNLLIDSEGTISISQMRISAEVWVHDGVTLYTPGQFLRVEQQSDLELPGVETKYFFKNGVCKIQVFLLEGVRNGFAGIEIELEALREDYFKNVAFFLVIRPYDHEGLSIINQLEYRNKRIRVNNVELFQLETEPKITFFTHAGLGDVAEYFKYGYSNSSVLASDGSGTGIIGYYVQPKDLLKVKLLVKSETSKIYFRKETDFPTRWFFESKQVRMNRYTLQHHMFSSGTKIDYLYHTNLNYLSMLTRPSLGSVDITRLLALNRFAFFNQSCNYLREIMKKVRWDGSLPVGLLNSEELVVAVVDYYKLSGDRRLVEDGWLNLKRIGFWLAQNKLSFKNDRRVNSYEKILWTCAAFRALALLSEVCGKLEENQFFQEHYQELWSQTLSSFTRSLKGNRKSGFIKAPFWSAGQVIKSLAASYPLQLFERNESFIGERLDDVFQDHLFNGGVISPLEFQGINLELTAKLGGILLREERDYDSVFKFLTKIVGSGGSWPDQIHPVFGGGIGQNGHDYKVSCHFLMLVRNIMVMEEGEILYLLPGIFNSNIWPDLSIELKCLPTFFGEISLKCKSIGSTVQIEFSPSFRKKPQQVRLLLKSGVQVLYADSEIRRQGEQVEIAPDFKVIRLRRELP